MKVYEDDEGPDVALRKLSQQSGVKGYVILNSTGSCHVRSALPRARARARIADPLP